MAMLYYGVVLSADEIKDSFRDYFKRAAQGSFYKPDHVKKILLAYMEDGSKYQEFNEDEQIVINSFFSFDYDGTNFGFRRYYDNNIFFGICCCILDAENNFDEVPKSYVNKKMVVSELSKRNIDERPRMYCGLKQ